MTQQQPTVLVVGSANVDMIVRSERLPRPGETVLGGHFITAGGGKGANQAIAARRLGARVAFVGRIGADGPGRTIQDSFRAEGIDSTHLSVDAESATGVALILVDREGQNLISVASGANRRVTADDVRSAARLFDSADVVVCQLEIPLDAVRTALAMAKDRKVTTILNPAPAQPIPDEILGLTDWLTPNEFEASTLTGIPVVDWDTARSAGQAALERGAGAVIVTLGDRGAILVSRARIESIDAVNVDAIDATAAGDAFTGALAVSLARGLAPAAALAYANTAGGLATTRPGAQPSLPTDDDVAALLRRLDRSRG